MNKKYILYQVKKLLPLYGIFLACLGITVVATSSLTSGFSYSYYNGTIAITNHLFPLFIVTVIFTFVTPFFSLAYRFKSSKADIYLQLPFKKNTLKITNLLIHIVMTMICFIVAGLFLMLILFIKQAINNPYPYRYVTPMVYVDPDDGGIATDYIETSTYITYYYNYGFYFLSLLLMAIFIAVEQIINNFVASFSNNRFDCFLYLVMFFLLRFLLLYGIGWYIFQSIYYYVFPSYSYLNLASLSLNMFYLNFTPVSSGFFVHYLTSAGASGYSSNYYFDPLYQNLEGSILVIVCIAAFLYIVLGVLAFLYQMFVTEKYGENLGRKRNNMLIDYLLPHLTIITLSFLWGLLWDIGSEVLDAILIFIVIAIFYYALLALLSRSFKISKKDLITAGIVLGTILIFRIQIIVAYNVFLS